jgi:drug/metabolite transporter (DMT)-like permease
VLRDHLGELAALTTAICWAFSSLAFTRAGRRIGALALNLVRLGFALGFSIILGLVARGLPLPTDATAEHWAWLSVSGLVGFVFGDLCLFRAFVLLGPRLALLIMATAPPMAALLGWLALDESLSLVAALGMALTVAGIAWVLAARPIAPPVTSPEGHVSKDMSIRTGIWLGLGGALGQAGGLVLSKRGMAGYDPFAATQVRILAGLVGFAAIYTAIGFWPTFIAALRDRSALALAAGGAFLGPFLGVSLSLLAVQRTETGVAASIMATTPILVIPLAAFIDREQIRWHDLAGAVLAIAGVALLFLR